MAAPVALPAAVRYWDLDGNIAGAGGASPSGIWDATVANWNQNANGNSAANTFTNGDDVYFSAGTNATGSYTVTLNGTQSVSSLNIEEGSPAFTGGTVNFSDATPAFVIASGATLNWGSTLLTATGNGSINLSGAGVLNFTQNLSFGGTLNFGGGTLRLSDATLNVTTLNITANSVIDFAGSASTLNVTNFNISAGVTLSIGSWTRSSDFFFVNNWAGATRNASGAPMNQIVFANWTGADTRWYSNNEVAPVPEPSTFAFIASGLALPFLARRPRRRALG